MVIHFGVCFIEFAIFPLYYLTFFPSETSITKFIITVDVLPVEKKSKNIIINNKK